MAIAGDNLCLPLEIIHNILKRLLPVKSVERIGGDNPFLPLDIIRNILKRLPVKSLVRFRAVCKDWKKLLQSPYFIAEHYHHSAHNNPLVICTDFSRNPRYSPLCLVPYKTETVEVERIPAMDSLRNLYSIIGSSNGLLCVIRDGIYNDSPPPWLLLLNPATREVRQVPRSAKDKALGWGFGLCPVVRDYKIVRIYATNRPSIKFDEDGGIHGEVFSLRTGSWKEVESGALRRLRAFPCHPLTFNGAIFWLGWGEASVKIVSFDLTMEVFTLIPTPFLIPLRTNPSSQIVLDVYENKVAVLFQYGDMLEPSFMDLWVLEGGSGACGKSWGWTKKYSIGPTSWGLSPLYFWRNEIVFRYIHEVHLLILTANRELKRFNIYPSINNVRQKLDYVESLMSMDGDSFCPTLARIEELSARE
ncbi:putative F-box/LRR-repeat/kelch-repeat protein At1g11620 [Neltuma alba]|uniref:putative F-box/LRR-repeat/kelch-repeat protein At1g11620 n=1 Tax=Neltuma alba TaxID=207710 RepID=UPI0010A40F6B|nr:putative F-box/LRR-repeat/kelch-repeat protein At1g11620 [Prosopis alba]